MKKIVTIIFAVVVVVGGFSLFQLYKTEYTGTEYYTQIVTEGKKVTHSMGEGQGEAASYEYTQIAVDANGNTKMVTFNGNKETPLRMNAYLKLSVNEKKGVLSWSEIREVEVPAKALGTL